MANVLIENVRLNDALEVSLDPHADGRLNASLVGFWSAMTPSGEAHRNITLRKVVAMRTLRDGINVHGHVVGFVGEDLHFENQGDDVRAFAGTWVHSSKSACRCGQVFAVWGAGGGDVNQTGFSKPYAKCGLTNTPATDVSFTRTFAKGISDWSSCAHVFGAGTVTYDQLVCCDLNGYPALSLDSTFCPDYSRADVTLDRLAWYDGHGRGRCTGSQEAMGKGGGLTAGLDCRHPADKCGRSECRTGGRSGPQ